MLSSLIAQMPPSLGGNPEGPGRLGPSFREAKMKTINVIYASGALAKFIQARAQGESKELLAQLSADALLEQEREKSRMPRATLDEVVIDFQRARRERPTQKAI